MAAQPKVKSYVADFTLLLGPIMASGKLMTIKSGDADEYKEFVSICPEESHKEPVLVQGGQRYVCQETILLDRDKWHVHTQSELSKAKQVGDDLIAMSPEEIAEAKKSTLDPNVLRLTVHPKEEVWNSTWLQGNAYVFVPKVANEFYALMVRLIQDSGKAFVGLCNLRNSEGLFRLDVWRDLIVVQKLLEPDGINPTEPVTADCEQEDLEGFLAVLDKKVKPFDPTSYTTSTRERLEALTAALTPTSGAAVTTKEATKEQKKSLADALAGWDTE